MTEWLSQYEKVAQRQQQYLQKIRDLRHRLQNRDERCTLLSIERMRRLPPLPGQPDASLPYSSLSHFPTATTTTPTPTTTTSSLFASFSPSSFSRHSSELYKSHVPWSSSLQAHHHIHQHHPHQPHHHLHSRGSGAGACWPPVLDPEGLDPRSGSPASRGADPALGRGAGCVVAGERLVPRLIQPRRRLQRSHLRAPQRSGKAGPGRPDPGVGAGKRADNPGLTLERTKTDYEPIEDIARRNRIQFSRYLSSRDGRDNEKTGNDDQAPPLAECKGLLRPGKDGVLVGNDRSGGCGDYVATGRSSLSVVANAGDIRHRDV